LADRYLQHLRKRLEGARRGGVLHVQAPPAFVPLRGDVSHLRGVYVLAPRSIRAWAALELDDPRLHFVDAAPGAGPRPLDDILIVMDRLPQPPPHAGGGPPVR
jgi:hypothetical protein